MTNDPNDVGDDPDNGGDIASGFGESTLTGPVSDEKVEVMRQWAATHSAPRRPTRALLKPATASEPRGRFLRSTRTGGTVPVRLPVPGFGSGRWRVTRHRLG